MKKNLSEDAKRIMQIMEGVEGTKILNELNIKYLDQLLDKVSAGGVESLNDYEKKALQKMSQNQDVNPPEVHSLGTNSDTLRFTSTDQNSGEILVQPKDRGKPFGKPRLENAYIRGEAAEIIGNDTPIFIDGDLSQLDKPKEEQDIRMLTPQGEYECEVEIRDMHGMEVYHITLKGPEEDEPDNDDDLSMLNEDMSEYGVYKDEENDDDMRAYNIFDDLEEEGGFATQTDADSHAMGDIEQTNEISSDTFKSAMEKTKEYGQHNRGYQMGSNFFREFQGKELMGSTIKEIGTYNSDSGLVVQITLTGLDQSREPSERHLAVYYVEKDTWEVVKGNSWNDIKDIDVTRKDARVLALIASTINSETRYKNINQEFSVDASYYQGGN